MSNFWHTICISFIWYHGKYQVISYSLLLRTHTNTADYKPRVQMLTIVWEGQSVNERPIEEKCKSYFTRIYLSVNTFSCGKLLCYSEAEIVLTQGCILCLEKKYAAQWPLVLSLTSVSLCTSKIHSTNLNISKC